MYIAEYEFVVQSAIEIIFIFVIYMFYLMYSWCNFATENARGYYMLAGEILQAI